MLNIKKVLGGAPSVSGVQSDIKDNLYMHVNYDWLKTAKIPSDMPDTGSFQVLDENVRKKLINDYKDFHAGKIKAPNSMFEEAMKLHSMILDVDKREKDGIKPILPILDIVKNIKNLDDFSQKLSFIIKNALPVPFYIDVEPDWKNTSKNVVFLYAPDLILPDKTYYGKKESDQLLDIWASMSKNLLNIIGYSDVEAENIVNGALAFDKSMVPYVMTSEELADMTKQYNPKNLSDINNYSSLEIGNVIIDLINDKPEKVIVTEPNFFDSLGKIINDNTFNNLKDWMIVETINKYSLYLSENIRKKASKFHLAISGVKEPLSLDKYAYNIINSTFNYVIGDFYGKKYFTKESIDDVTKIIKGLINVYKKRLENNDWLGSKTKAKAILKLDKIAIKVGYPEKIKPVYEKLHVICSKDGGTLLSNYVNIMKVFIEDNFEKFHKSVDRSEWDMPSHLVNACYDPSRNDITFPAAILEKPFYDISQSHSANYGGIGCVMGHEISHAFDNNGSHFDEYGNMIDWWTTEDEKHFEKLTQKMIDLFDGIPFAGGKVNGKLVVSENIADNGGMSCSLEALKQYNDFNLKDFFINWATIWRMKASKQYERMLLAIDVHAPEELRGNVVPQNFDDFYNTFDITSKDGMWLDPKRRVHIW